MRERQRGGGGAGDGSAQGSEYLHHRFHQHEAVRVPEQGGAGVAGSRRDGPLGRRGSVRLAGCACSPRRAVTDMCTEHRKTDRQTETDNG